MSASREKKARQEFNASGAVDPKAAREAQERAKPVSYTHLTLPTT